MFQDKNTSDKKNEQANFNSYLAPSVPVHLMKNDLAEIKNPQKDLPKQSPESLIMPSNLSEKQKTSPFLNIDTSRKIQENEPKTAPEPFPPLPSKEFAQEIKKTEPLRPTENFALNKIVVMLILFFLLLIVGVGGYYFWIIRAANQTNNQTTINNTESQPAIIEPEPITQSEKSIDLSTEKPNYFSIDIATADKTSINNQLDLYLKKAEELKITSPAEFIVTDASNNPVSFKVFAEKIGITLPTQITSLLKDTFSLYIYNDNGNYRLGLSINSLDDAKLKTALLKEESKLVAYLAPILKNPDNKPFVEKEYQINTYKTTNKIRYLNIISAEYLSIDYIVLNKALAIGTTQNTMYALIDYLSAPKKDTPKEATKIPATNEIPGSTESVK
jgi:hypothetical protein